MGGKKKPTISQLAKKEAREKEQVEKKGKGKGKAAEEVVKKVVATVPAELYDQITKDIKGMDYVTTYIISSKYGLKMGAATRVLNDLAKKGELVLVSKGHRMSVYTPVERARKLGLIQ
jgi:small subunit ribosomal protein S25e